jgi:hypothetical protein
MTTSDYHEVDLTQRTPPNCAYRSLLFCTSHLFRAMTQPTYIPIMRDHVSKLLVDLPTVGPLETQYFLGTGHPQTLIQRC